MNTITIKLENLSKHNQLYNEWLITNGLGGFASHPLGGTPMRKYDSYLTAALPAPYGRVIMLNTLQESIVLPDGKEIFLSHLKHGPQETLEDIPLVEFRQEDGLPIWKYAFDGIVIERKIFLVYKQNTIHISYKLLSSGGPLKIKWRPYFHFRNQEQPVDYKIQNEEYIITANGNQYEINCAGFPPLHIYNSHPIFIHQKTIETIYYEIEEKRGYEFQGNLTGLGYFEVDLKAEEETVFIASTESWETIYALSHEMAYLTERIRRKNLLKKAKPYIRSETAQKLALAADQFIITPTTRYKDMVKLRALGEEAKTIIAGYPWFTDWGRDTMISLEGLALSTGQYSVAESILRTYAFYIKDGLIPNRFPDGQYEGIYNTADATLWFFHAAERYIEVTGDREILDFLLPFFRDIITQHIKGTLFGIKVDEDGLLVQGQEGLQLTWMDAKVGDWVVTPRRGKAVEINALWYNALKLFEEWSGAKLELTEKCFHSFNQRFWFEKGQYLYDVVDGEHGDDFSLRPNQLLAISLKYPVLEMSCWKSILDCVEKELLTPYGLRTLARTHSDFKAYYHGDLRTRDAAYHQGTVWPWLIGPFIDVWLKVYPKDTESCRHFLKGLEEHLYQSCAGSIGEIFDSMDPYHARGCFAQAWSVAEFLRSETKIYQLDGKISI